MKEHYEISGLSEQAGAHEITRAYVRLSQLYSPDALPADARDYAPHPDLRFATGSYLRWSRERAGISIGQLADRTKISPAILEALEAERFQRLPSAFYLRGYLREIGRRLGIADTLPLADVYEQRAHAAART